VLRRAHGIIVASPGYHGSMSGLVKNALDYAEDMRDDDDALFRRPRGRTHRLRFRLAGDRHDVERAALDRACAARLADAARRRDQYERIGGFDKDNISMSPAVAGQLTLIG
jgi:multimeric flavodoxin WrbA